MTSDKWGVGGVDPDDLDEAAEVTPDTDPEAVADDSDTDLPVEANEADVIDQRRPVPIRDEDYPSE